MNNYTIKYGESIFDVAIKLYGDSSYSLELVNNNPSLISLNNANITGLTIQYNPVINTEFKPVITSESVKQKLVTIRENQNLFDISLQEFGTIERVFDIISKTGIENINQTEIKGITFKYDFEKGKIQNYFNDKKIFISTKTPNKLRYIIDRDGNIIWDETDQLIY